MSIISINNLTKVYKSTDKENLVALDNFSITLNKGDFVMIVGNNAAGKSTLFKTIMGITKPTKGEILLLGKNLIGESVMEISKVVSSIQQNPNMSLFKTMTILENFSIVKFKENCSWFRIGVKRKWIQEFKQLLIPINMGLERRMYDKVANLSGGQKQVIALIMATMNTPRLLLLDEPTAALDPKSGKFIMEIIKRILREKKITTLMVTHNLRLASKYGNRLIILKEGKIRLDITGKEKRLFSLSDLEKYFDDQY